MKKAATELAERARASVGAARRSVAVNKQTNVISPAAARAHVSSISNSLSRGSIDQSNSAAGFGLVSSVDGRGVVPPTPSLDRIEVTRSSRGVGDSTACLVVISFETIELSKLTTLRIMRANLGPAGSPSPLMTGLQQLLPVSSVRKDLDPLFRLATSLSQSAVSSHVMTVVNDRPGMGYRTSVSSGSAALNVVAPSKIIGRQAGRQDLMTITGVDRSVLANPNFFLNRKALGAIPDVVLPKTVSVGSNILSSDSRSAIVHVGTDSSFAVERSNSWEFTELASVSVDSAAVSQVGMFSEISFVDPSVTYGQKYAFYVIAIDDHMRESIRSKIVTISIDVSLCAEPVTGSFIISSGIPSFGLISRGAQHFEAYRRAGKQKAMSARVVARPGSITSRVVQQSTDGFLLLSEVSCMGSGEATFVDRTAPIETDLMYRFYAVDGFGNKVQTPYEAMVRIPDRGSTVSFVPPTIDVDITADGKSLKVNVSCKDERIFGLRVTRRDVTGLESAFHSPNEPERCTIGQRDVKRRNSSIGERFVAPDAWNGYVRNTPGSISSFIDSTLSFDHTYQYLVEGIDRGGNIAGPSISIPIGLFSRSICAAPTGLSVIIDGSKAVLTWQDESVDVSPEEMLGSVSRLTDSSVKVVFQVERRASDERRWTVMPATSTPSFTDQTVETGISYVYRVVAMRAGGMISPYSEAVSILIDKLIDPPESLKISASNTSVRPIDVTVSWEYSGTDIGSWEIERASVNSFAASRVRSQIDISKLSFEPLGVVTRESSRGLSAGRDAGGSLRMFIDRDVNMANGWYYRIRAISAMNSSMRSSWAFAGMTFEDTQFRKKLSSTVTAQQKRQLTESSVPVRTKVR